MRSLLLRICFGGVSSEQLTDRNLRQCFCRTCHRITSSHMGSGDSTGALLSDIDDGGENGGVGDGDGDGEGGVSSFGPPSPPSHRRRLPRFLRHEKDGSSSPLLLSSSSSSVPSTMMGSGGGSRGEDSSMSLDGADRGGDECQAAGAAGGGGRGLFVPLLGTRLDNQVQGREAGLGSGTCGDKDDEDTNASATADGDSGGSCDGAVASSPSRFAWRWMGLRPADVTTATATTPPPPMSLAPYSGRQLDQQQQQHHQDSRHGGSGSVSGVGGNIDGSMFFSSSRHSHDHGQVVLSPPQAFGVVVPTTDDNMGVFGSSAPHHSRISSSGSSETPHNRGALEGREGTSSVGNNYSHPSDSLMEELRGVRGGDRANFGGPVDSLRRPLPRPTGPSSTSFASSDIRTVGRRSSGIDSQPRSKSRVPQRASSAGSNVAPPQPAITGTASAVSNETLVAARSDNASADNVGATVAVVAGVRRGGAVDLSRPGAAVNAGRRSRRGGGRWGGTEPVAMGLGASRARRLGGGYTAPREEAYEAGCVEAAVACEQETNGVGARDVKAGDTDGRVEGAVRAGGQAFGRMAADVGAGASPSSPTSSSSFSLNGFEVIDKDEDMWN